MTAQCDIVPEHLLLGILHLNGFKVILVNSYVMSQLLGEY